MKTFRAGLVFLCMLLASPAIAGMTALGDGELAAFHAGSGVSQDVTGTAKITIGSIYYQDTDTKNRIELNNIVWGGNEAGGAFSLSTPAGDPNTIDIGSNASGAYVNIHDATNVQPRTFSANLHFDEYDTSATNAQSYDPGHYDPVRDIDDYMTNYIVHDLGTIEVSNIVRTENNLMIGAHGGVSFEYREKTAIDYAKYTYNTTGSDNALTFDGIHLSDTATWDPDTNPNTWSYSGPFQIGDMTSATPNPAKIDIGTDSSGTTVMQYQLPMTGTIIIEDVIFGTDAGNPKHFGPMVLDNLNVHSLALSINPNP